jgi:hypothetical protein
MRRLLLAIVGAGSAVPAALLAFGDGPAPGATGGFGEPTCASCHVDAPTNASVGLLAIDGLPSAFSPGTQYIVSVTLTRVDLMRAGFALAARYAEGTSRGQQAGHLDELDARVQILTSGTRPVQYAVHTAAGSHASTPGSSTWRMMWTAPLDPQGPVVFHLAVNAANDDGSPLGDAIYLREAHVTVQ